MLFLNLAQISADSVGRWSVRRCNTLLHSIATADFCYSFDQCIPLSGVQICLASSRVRVLHAAAREAGGSGSLRQGM
jgi:hypothetical protein